MNTDKANTHYVCVNLHLIFYPIKAVSVAISMHKEDLCWLMLVIT